MSLRSRSSPVRAVRPGRLRAIDAAAHRHHARSDRRRATGASPPRRRRRATRRRRSACWPPRRRAPPRVPTCSSAMCAAWPTPARCNAPPTALEAAQRANPTDRRLIYEQARLEAAHRRRSGCGDVAGSAVAGPTRAMPPCSRPVGSRSISLAITQRRRKATARRLRWHRTVPRRATTWRFRFCCRAHRDESRAMLEQARAGDNAPARVANNLAFVRADSGH